MEQLNILEYYAKTSGSFLHARGPIATNKLIDFLEVKSGDKILEFGCGTGATLVRIATNFSQVELVGIDLSKDMLDSAKKRVKFSNLSGKVSLRRVKEVERLPFEDDTFDKVYVESVLGIQENSSLLNSITEIKRVLKKGGKLVMNETLWYDNFPANRARDINKACIEKFGIIQANSDYGYVAEWKGLFEEFGFKLEKSISVDQISDSEDSKLKANWRSNLITFFGKINRKLSYRLSAARKRHEKEMSKIIEVEDKIMEGTIFQFRLTDLN